MLAPNTTDNDLYKYASITPGTGPALEPKIKKSGGRIIIFKLSFDPDVGRQA